MVALLSFCVNNRSKINIVKIFIENFLRARKCQVRTSNFRFEFYIKNVDTYPYFLRQTEKAQMLTISSTYEWLVINIHNIISVIHEKCATFYRRRKTTKLFQNTKKLPIKT